MPRCIVGVVAALLFADGASVISHRVHVLRPASCARTARAHRGDDISTRLSALRVGGEESLLSSDSDDADAERHAVANWRTLQDLLVDVF